MVSEDVAAVMQLADAIGSCKVTGEDFWQKVVIRIAYDLGEHGDAYAVGYVRGLLGEMWNQLPYTPGLAEDLAGMSESLRKIQGK